MINSDPVSSSSSSPGPARGYKTRTTTGALQRCSTWVQQLQGESDSTHNSKPLLSEQFKDSELSQDEFSESSEVSLRSKRRYSTNPIGVNQDDTEVDTSVASEVVSQLPVRKKIRTQIINLEPTCEWKGCKYKTADLTAYVKHVSSHLPNIKVKVCEGTEDEEVYVCLWESCDFETPNSDEVSRHVNFHSYHTKMKCLGAAICSELDLPDCHYGVDGANLVPDLPELYECCWSDCSYTSNNPNTFFNHVQLHATESDGTSVGEKVFSCEWRGCKTEVRKRQRLNEHVRTHSKEKLVACPTCGSLFASRVKLIDHRRRQSTEEWNTFQCSHCSRFYPSERLLRDHMRHHVNKYKCQFCDMTCPSPWTLSSHIRHRHIDDKPFQCEYCTYQAKTHFNLKRHLTTHTNLSSFNFTCEMSDCDYKCHSLFMLNWHFRKEHEAPQIYCCHMCDCRFTRGAYLTKHLMDKHNFRWPSGHSRFRYKHDEDGLFRLQTVRYESLDVVEDINRGDGEQTPALKTDVNFTLKTQLLSGRGLAAKVMIKQKFEDDNDYDDDPDDPDEVDECKMKYSLRKENLKENSSVTGSGGPSMPLLDVDSPPPSARKVLISIDEVDNSGNIIRSSTLEADEITDVDESAQVVLDGDCIL